MRVLITTRSTTGDELLVTHDASAAYPYAVIETGLRGAERRAPSALIFNCCDQNEAVETYARRARRMVVASCATVKA